MALSPELISILVCPQCKGKLDMEPNETAFLCSACRLRYPVREGIPVMLVDEAEKI
ncbi:Trm112 family protein [Geobacter pelophilus]|uniref:UPF0434 protein KI809_14705 n=1 Tax=Geoanaerobacter pelophilus TaxID=60036 RepID=A0AAW4LB09_9BACT|nr:Trm112 family protein [Geoanaerobacter pelophilus]MBT0665556.1 Trm112 family protein [Geoanaerobacter pelophilus]